MQSRLFLSAIHDFGEKEVRGLFGGLALQLVNCMALLPITVLAEESVSGADALTEEAGTAGEIAEASAVPAEDDVLPRGDGDAEGHYLKEHGCEIVESSKGIYHIEGKTWFPTQIVVTSELNEDAHLWVKALSGNLGKETFRKMLEQRSQMTEKADRELADSVLEVSFSANKEIVDELIGDESMYEVSSLKNNIWRNLLQFPQQYVIYYYSHLKNRYLRNTLSAYA